MWVITYGIKLFTVEEWQNMPGMYYIYVESQAVCFLAFVITMVTITAGLMMLILDQGLKLDH